MRWIARERDARRRAELDVLEAECRQQVHESASTAAEERGLRYAADAEVARMKRAMPEMQSAA